jgi:hypothetical protein
LSAAGIINKYADSNGHTPIHELLREFERSSARVAQHLESHVERLRKQLTNVLSTDAFADLDARRAVLTTVSRQRGQRLADSQLYSPIERELIECYRNLGADGPDVPSGRHPRVLHRLAHQ